MDKPLNNVPKYGLAMLLFATLACRLMTFGSPPVVATQAVETTAPSRSMAVSPTPNIKPTVTSAVASTPLAASHEKIDHQGVTMILIPGGEFEMGFNPSALYDYERANFLFEARPQYRPAHQVTVSQFYLDQYEVSNEQYRSCVFANACKVPEMNGIRGIKDYYNKSEYKNYPVVGVTWEMAKSFCEWRGSRLPTEAEWERAAKGENNSAYPWNGNSQNCRIANYLNCANHPVAVDSFPEGVNSYGIYNLAGNVAEWTSSLFLPYPYNASDGREDMTIQGERSVRGGSWDSHGGNADIYTFARYGYYAMKNNYNDYTGFRCAKSLEP